MPPPKLNFSVNFNGDTARWITREVDRQRKAALSRAEKEGRSKAEIELVLRPITKSAITRDLVNKCIDAIESKRIQKQMEREFNVTIQPEEKEQAGLLALGGGG